jgi:intracellular multiplication protein IcmP
MADHQQKDSSSDIMWLMAVIAGVTLFITWKFGTQLKAFYLTLKLIQIKFILLAYPSDFLLQAKDTIESTRPIDVSFKQLLYIGGKVGWFINIPLIAGLSYWGYQIWEKNPLQKFKRVLTMQSLKESEQRLWPYISPMVNVNLMKESFDNGPYAMALKPYTFAVKYHLLQEEKNVDSLDRKKAEKLFVSQLGKPFSDFSRLRKHEQALLAIFAATGCGDKDGAMNAINKIAISAAQIGVKKMPDFSSAKPLFKYLENPKVVEVFKKNAYVYTLLASMLEFARGTGVFPPSYFIWLKPRDRTLWYTLNCVGRQVPFVEVAGIFGHWKAEQIANHKLDSPYVIKAVDGLERALGEVKIV